MNIEKIYRNYGQMLMDISYRITRNNADSEEILQESFIELWKRKPEGAIIAWLKKVVVNKSLNLVRDRKRIKRDVDSPTTPHVLIEEEEKARVVKSALSRLEPIENAVIILKRYHGISHREIAEILEISEGNSRVILYRAMNKLKGILKPYVLRGEINV